MGTKHSKNLWMVDAIEVLVKITKKCLKMIAKDCLLNEETLPTVLAEVKGITKTRYLTIKTI